MSPISKIFQSFEQRLKMNISIEDITDQSIITTTRRNVYIQVDDQVGFAIGDFILSEMGRGDLVNIW